MALPKLWGAVSPVGKGSYILIQICCNLEVYTLPSLDGSRVEELEAGSAGLMTGGCCHQQGSSQLTDLGSILAPGCLTGEANL